MTLYELVKKHIHEMILNLARDMSDINLTSDEAAGVPMLLFQLEEKLLAALDELAEAKR